MDVVCKEGLLKGIMFVDELTGSNVGADDKGVSDRQEPGESDGFNEELSYTPHLTISRRPSRNI